MVGNSSLSAGDRLQVFVWSKTVGMVGLGLLPVSRTLGAQYQQPRAGGWLFYCALARVVNRGFYWGSAAGTKQVGTLPGGSAVMPLGGTGRELRKVSAF